MTTLDDLLACVRAFVGDNYEDIAAEIRITLVSGRRIQLPMPTRLANGPTPPPTESKPPSTTRHSEDFRSVNWYGTQYQFTAKQAAVVQRLWEAWEDETPEVSQAALLEAADSDSDRLRELFRVGKDLHPSWGKMIVQGERRGTYRLVTP